MSFDKQAWMREYRRQNRERIAAQDKARSQRNREREIVVMADTPEVREAWNRYVREKARRVSV